METFHPFHRAGWELRQQAIFRSMTLQPFAVTGSSIPLMQALFLRKMLEHFSKCPRAPQIHAWMGRLPITEPCSRGQSEEDTRVEDIEGAGKPILGSV